MQSVGYPMIEMGGKNLQGCAGFLQRGVSIWTILILMALAHMAPGVFPTQYFGLGHPKKLVPGGRQGLHLQLGFCSSQCFAKEK